MEDLAANYSTFIITKTQFFYMISSNYALSVKQSTKTKQEREREKERERERER